MIESLNEWGQIWLRYLSCSVVQNTLFLAIIFYILHRIRNVSAGFRYIIAFIGLLKLFLPAIIPAPIHIQLFRNAGTAVTAIPLHAAGAAAVTAAPQPAPGITTAGLLFLIWLTVAIALILLPALSTLRLKLRLKDAHKLPADGLLPSGISLYQSGKVAIPMSIGVLPRKIYVPANWHAWSAECRAMILTHELAHIHRLDGLARCIQSLAGALYFFHPLVWLLSRRVDELREMACDDSTISQGKSCSPVAYSRTLVEIAEAMTSPGLGCGSASALIKKRQELYNRVRYQMEAHMKTISRRTGILLIGLVMAAGFMLSFNGTLITAPVAAGSAAIDTKGIITGTVVDAKTGDPLHGANVTVNNAAGKAVSDSEGRFRITGIPAGTYTLETACKGYEKTLTAVSLKKEETVTVQITMQPEDRQSDSVTVTPAAESKSRDEVFFAVFDKPPEPIGGWAALSGSLNYPETAKEAGITGKVRVHAHIDTAGNVLHTKILEGLEGGCSEAAMEAVKMTKWNPATQKGKPVNVWVAVPVLFKLDAGKPSEAPSLPGEINEPPQPPPPSPPPPPASPAPPPGTAAEKEVFYVKFDIGPEPIGGWAVLSDNLRYPETAKEAGIEGIVKVHTRIDTTGNVTAVKILQGLEGGCSEAAMEAVKMTKWKPATLKGKPINVWVAVPVRFQLKK